MSKIKEEYIEKALRSEPEFQPSLGFSDKVFKAIRKKEQRSQRRLYLLMILGCLLMFLFGLGAMVIFQPELFQSSELFGLDSQFNKVLPFAVFLGILIVIFQYFDNKLVKEKNFFG